MDPQGKLRILFLPAWHWYPDRNHPARGVSVQEQAKAVSLFHEITVLYVEAGESRRWRQTVSDGEEGGIPTVRMKHRRLPIPFSTLARYLWGVRKGFRELWQRGLHPDIIHAHGYNAGIAAVMLGRKYALPVVISEHCSDFIRGKLRKRDILKARFAMNRADAVLPVGEEVRRALRALGVRLPLEVIPNTIDTRVFRPAPCREISAGGTKTILLIALLRDGKGISGFLHALAELKKKRRDFRIEVVGDGPKRTHYQQLAAELGLGAAVRFQGMKTRPEVAELIRGSDFLVQPSPSETFGMTVIEAMACGKPVVATRIPAFEEKISGERGVLVPPGDAEALARALDYMLDHHREYPGDRIVRYVEENFSHQVVGKQLSDIYRSVLEGWGN